MVKKSRKWLFYYEIILNDGVLEKYHIVDVRIMRSFALRCIIAKLSRG